MDRDTMDTQATPAQPARTPEVTWTPVTVEITGPARARWSRRMLALVAGGALVALTVGASAAMASGPAAAPVGGAIPVDAASADAAFKDFAACMRKNGIDMPDPVTLTGGPAAVAAGPTTVSSGPITVIGGPGAAGSTVTSGSGASIVVGSGVAQAVAVDDAAFRAANDACSPILEAAGIKSGTGTIVSGVGTLSLGAGGGAGTAGVVVAGAGGDATKMAADLKTYAACMRTNGVDMPDPVVDTKAGTVQLQFGGDAGSAAFRAADKTCATGGFGLAIPVAAPTRP
jgi:hypothetical protein